MTKEECLEEDDYYTQGFEKEGVVSIWLGVEAADESIEVDVLQDLCGVGYYDLANQESEYIESGIVDIAELFTEISYASSFEKSAIDSAKSIGITKARWLICQFDFDYDPKKITRSVQSDPVFIGSFAYEEDD
ncbi:MULTISPECIES: immunity 22 family protein [unclassified Pseudoalteromonas]|uniref:immunity 22 family protein n=1 Tax=unclassified Pseudoalteromonas TaxID=194690 RepID=UPI0019D17DE0|nr:immunity 22 family protein [Pseudoalteromonas sp. JC3]MBR8841857.1 immunity 22 family protein [Pseudoalteromonas sp. JC3]WJE11146.1 immunity 22 family protein [Pseudoalteromonas sp. JC3]